jgi:hypothetical protein
MRRWIGVALVLLLAPIFIPTTVSAQDETCFEETGFCISGRIREYWQTNGGLGVFGLPITAQASQIVEDKTIEVQWFERVRLELHSDQAAPYDVLLGRLGLEQLQLEGRSLESFPASEAQENCRFFSETNQNICGAFLNAWRSYGLELDDQASKSEAENLALFGLPISPVITENIEGNDYSVQYFERARFELHPEIGPDTVLFGLLGNEVYTAITTPPDPRPIAPEEPVDIPELPPTSFYYCKDDPKNYDKAPNYPVKITNIDKRAEIVTLQNMTGHPVDLTGWRMCSYKGDQEHLGIGGVLGPWEGREFPNIQGENIWSNNSTDEGGLYNDNGQLVSYWPDAR